jgi:hypothetical protein
MSFGGLRRDCRIEKDTAGVVTERGMDRFGGGPGALGIRLRVFAFPSNEMRFIQYVT